MSINFMNYFKDDKIAKEASREFVLRLKILASVADYVYCAGQCYELLGDGFVDFYEGEQIYNDACKVIELVYLKLDKDISSTAKKNMRRAFRRLMSDPGFSHYVSEYLNLALMQEVTIVRGPWELLDGYETLVRTKLWNHARF